MKKNYLVLLLISFNTYANIENKSICHHELNLSNELIFTNASLVPHTGKILCRFFPNQTIRSQGFLLDGKKHGKWILFNENGQITYEMKFLNGQEKLSKQYGWYENGQMKYERNAKDELLDGSSIFLNPDGIIQENFVYKEGKLHGPFSLFNIHGQKTHTGNYRNGKKNGLFIWWYRNGQKWVEIKYKNNAIIKRFEWDKYGNKKWNCLGFC
jgi:antitoxin component YwqK of YwqJK toxin-antitoxin module